MTDERGGIEAGQFFLTNRERDDWNVLGRNLLVGELQVERDVGIPVDRGHHRGRFAGGPKAPDGRHPCLPVRVAERRVVNGEIFLRYPLLLQVGLKDPVRGPGIHIVGAFKHPALDTHFLHQVVDCRDRLLIRHRAGVDDVLRGLFPFVLDRIKEETIQLFKHREHRFPRHGRPAPEDDVDLFRLEQ